MKDTSKTLRFERFIRNMPEAWFETSHPVHFTESERMQDNFQFVPMIEKKECTSILNMWIAGQHLFGKEKNSFSMRQLESLRIGHPSFQPIVTLVESLRADLAGKKYPLRTILKKREEGQGLTAREHQHRCPPAAELYWILFLNQSNRGGNWILPDYRLFGGPRPGWILRFPAKARMVITPLGFAADPLFSLEGWVTSEPNLAETID